MLEIPGAIKRSRRMHNNKPIGVFDSGLGGTTAVKALRSIMPNENVVYFGDTGRVPYGNKSADTIKKYALQDIAFLKSMDVKIIVAACGTVSSYLQEMDGCTSVIGIIDSACTAAVEATKNNKIGVIGTGATVKSGAYPGIIESLKPGVRVYQQACPLFVPLVESGIIDENNEILKKVVEMYLNPLASTGVDTLIMGCTHYPIIQKAIDNFLNKKVNLINVGEETAKYVKKILKDQNLMSERTEQGSVSFFVSDEMENFSDTACRFLGYDVHDNVKKIDIDKF